MMTLHTISVIDDTIRLPGASASFGAPHIFPGWTSMMIPVKTSRTYALVQLRAFVEATRDSGYRNAAFAIAELIDNAVEAGAEKVDIEILQDTSGNSPDLSIVVTDDGSGMDREVIALSLQFGGSTRFGSRTGFGRFGMGLPNSALSQARRVEVVSWLDRSEVWKTYLDVDEVYRDNITSIPKPKRISYSPKTKTGTIVKLSKCDRLRYRSVEQAVENLCKEIGRMFRHLLFSGLSIRVNQCAVCPIDPLFVRGIRKGPRGLVYGPPFEYQVRVPDSEQTSKIKVSFAELPLRDWNTLSNQEKNWMGIAKGAGVSILRGGREIDHGWFFMDGKRKENYDDWWRCEINFAPELDEMFGVTHTKQGIRPSDELISLLSPDIGRIARELNTRVRKEYADIKILESKHTRLAGPQRRDYLLEPPTVAVNAPRSSIALHSRRRITSVPIGGLHYVIQEKKSDAAAFYDVLINGREITIILNELHPFYEHIYKRMPEAASGTSREIPIIENIRALLAAAARAEATLEKPSHREIIHQFRDSWSNALVAFLP
jgi:hypothetical protein